MKELAMLYSLLIWAGLVFASCSMPVEVSGETKHVFTLDTEIIKEHCANKLELDTIPESQWTSLEKKKFDDCVVEEYDKLLEVLDAFSN